MIELVDVVKIYPGTAEPAVNHVSFKVPAGETCVLIGPSGCGKTTTLKMVNRLVEPTSGEIWLDGANILQQDPVQIRRHIGYVIQQIGLFPHMTVRDNIATVPRLLGWKRPRIDARVDELLAMVGMEPASYRDRYPRELSGGQQQRVGVARALAADPPVMLMDEPFGAIDPIARDHLQNEFLRLQDRIKKTIIFVTHDIDEALKMGTLIGILRKGGSLAQFDTPAQILASPADPFVAAFVGADRGLKQLSLIRVRDLVHREMLLALPTDPVELVTARMREARVDSVLVVDDEGRLIGSASLDALEAGSGKRVGELTQPVSARTEEESTMKDAFSQMLSSGMSYIPVVDEKQRLLGIVTARDVQRFIETSTTRSGSGS